MLAIFAESDAFAVHIRFARIVAFCKLMQKFVLFTAVVAVTSLAALQAHAFIINIEPFDLGSYFDGFHNPGVQNYTVSTGPGATDFRNFFVFDLSSLNGTVNTASLHLRRFNSGGLFGDSYSNWDVTTPIPALLAGGTGTSARPGTRRP